jgi:fumarate hydratase, class II
MTLKEAALKSGYIDETRFDAIVDPKQMVGHLDRLLILSCGL